jgi:hypothetical protein
LEIDSIVQKYKVDWCAFEIKRGAAQTVEAARNLNRLIVLLDNQHIKPPKSLNIITGTGICYTTPSDGINVISLAGFGAR